MTPQSTMEGRSRYHRTTPNQVAPEPTPTRTLPSTIQNGTLHWMEHVLFVKCLGPGAPEGCITAEAAAQAVGLHPKPGSAVACRRV